MLGRPLRTWQSVKEFRGWALALAWAQRLDLPSDRQMVPGYGKYPIPLRSRAGCERSIYLNRFRRRIHTLGRNYCHRRTRGLECMCRTSKRSFRGMFQRATCKTGRLGTLELDRHLWGKLCRGRRLLVQEMWDVGLDAPWANFMDMCAIMSSCQICIDVIPKECEKVGSGTYSS